MKKSKKMGAVILGMAALTLATTSVVAVNNKQEVKAASYFDRVSMKYCKVQLEAQTMPWTGEQVCPRVTVTYDGKELVEGKDFKVKYKDNVDSGVATATVKGIGEEFKGKQKVQYYVKGININDVCTVKLENFSYRNNRVINDKIYLYDGDQIVDPSNYKVSIVKTKEQCDDGAFLAHYMVTTKYVIQGKGKYEGVMVYEQKGVCKRLSDTMYQVIGEVLEAVVEATEKNLDDQVAAEEKAAEATGAEILADDVVIVNE
ncbi:MAG: hypothetical protein E7262_08400 [Lachnospiraceae bacterium]|nr:hypothetical protein [Lachnospiraceae bacterium]